MKQKNKGLILTDGTIIMPESISKNPEQFMADFGANSQKSLQARKGHFVESIKTFPKINSVQYILTEQGTEYIKDLNKIPAYLNTSSLEMRATVLKGPRISVGITENDIYALLSLHAYETIDNKTYITSVFDNKMYLTREGEEKFLILKNNMPQRPNKNAIEDINPEKELSNLVSEVDGTISMMYKSEKRPGLTILESNYWNSNGEGDHVENYRRELVGEETFQPIDVTLKNKYKKLLSTNDDPILSRYN